MAINPTVSGPATRVQGSASASSSTAVGRFANSQALRKIEASWKSEGNSPVYASATFNASSQKTLKS